MMNDIDLARVDLNLLVLFDAVSTERHVGRAAERLHLTSSAVSHGLHRLRQLLNDPLFLRTSKGVVPTARATDLAGPVAEILARTKNILASSEQFNPARSTRRFTIGAPDGLSTAILPRLLTWLRADAPGIDISMRQVLPTKEKVSPNRAWQAAFAELEAREIDLIIIPTAEIPASYHAQPLFEEDFVVVMRTNHPLNRKLTLDQFCKMQHLVVSDTGEAHSFIDEALEARGKVRRIALTVPNSMLALFVVAETDLVCTMPRRFAAIHGARFGVVSLIPPLALSKFQINAVTSKAAMMDDGVAWLFSVIANIEQSAQEPDIARARRR